MSTLKVLELDTWMAVDWMREDTLEGYTACEPVFGRPGKYHRRGSGSAEATEQTWFELPDGRAFVYPQKQFDYELDLLHTERLNARQVDALANLVAQKLASKQQKRLYRLVQDADQIRATGRNARATSMRFRKVHAVARASQASPAPQAPRPKPRA